MVSPSSLSLPSLLDPAPLGLESIIAVLGFSLEGPLPSAEATNYTEDQDNFSQPGLTSSSMSEKHFEGDLTFYIATESNILVEGPEWVAKRSNGSQGAQIAYQG